MVDEYQDTNRPQYLLVKQIAGKHRNLAVVGDPDQSIYKWRGADLRNIMDFETDFSDAQIVRLEQNYRSTEVILDAASAVIANNRNRKKKALWTDLKGGAKIRLFRGSDELEEAEYITRTVRKTLEGDYSSLTAVLYRTNAQSRAVEDSLRAAGIAYVVLGGVGFYERREIKDALSYLKLILNPHDDVALAAGHQRAGARYRQGRDGRARSRRCVRGRYQPAAAACRVGADGRAEFAVDQARDGR